MIPDLDVTLRNLLKQKAPPSCGLLRAEGTDISFDLPSAEWRGSLEHLTLNCYLYDIRENLARRTHESFIQRSDGGTRAMRRLAPVRIDCGYCITAWSTAGSGAVDGSGLAVAVQQEHQLLSEALRVLLLHPSIPSDVLHGSLVDQVPPYPSVIASDEGVRNQPEFWGTLNQPVKPSLNYVVTLVMLLDEEPLEFEPVVAHVTVDADHLAGRGEAD